MKKLSQLSSHRSMVATMTATMAAMAASTMTACSPMTASFKAAPNTDQSVMTGGSGPDLLTCLNDAPDYALTAKIMNFEMTDSTGVKVGANTGISGVPVGVQLGVTYSTGTLTTAMALNRPLYGPAPLPTTQGAASSSNIGFDVGLSASIAHLDITQYSSTPLAELSNSALSTNLGNSAKSIPFPWSAQISAIYSDSQFEIPIGSVSGIQVGDEFNIYKVAYVWAGAPCASNLKIVRQLSTVPYAKAVVSQTSGTTTILTIQSINNNVQVSLHDQLMVSKLFAPATTQCSTDFWGTQTCNQVSATRAPLKRSLRVVSVTGQPIPFNNGQTTVTLDIAPMVQIQLETLIGSESSPFYLVN